MAIKDLHKAPFEESTITKLEIFEDYAQAWLPTFIMQRVPTICIFDFFAGTGYDKAGIPGSPIRILEKIREQIGIVFQNKVKIKFYLNEFEPNKKEQVKFAQLKSCCCEYLDKHTDVKRAIDIHYYNESCEALFPKLLPEIRKHPSLVYLDQNGIKFLSNRYLLELEKTSQTDFLYFVSASYFLRFGAVQEFKEHVDIDLEAAKKDPYRYIHRNITDQLRNKLPDNTKLRLYPFSIKKGANIHGIIFGATHPRAVDKFLTIAWKRNEINGQADFDIDEDESKGQLDLWGGRKRKKIEVFQDNLRRFVLSKEITNNFEAYAFVLNEGHISIHAAICLKKMKKDGEIFFEGSSPLVTYENVHKNKRELKFIIIDNGTK